MSTAGSNTVAASRSKSALQIEVCFYSYFKGLTGTEKTVETVSAGTTLGEFFEQLAAKFPKLAAMRKSTLMAVGVEYQSGDYVLKEGDEVSFFPPVQGG